MKTFKQFITEQQEFDLEQFKKDCAFVLEQLAGTKGKKLLYHGTTTNISDDFDVFQFRARTKPRDSTRSMHDRLNSFFTDQFGGPIRNWMFVTGRKNDALMYGYVHAIFPIGEFDWVCGLDDDLHDLAGWHSMLSAQIFNADTTRKLAYDQRDVLATDHMINKMRHQKWKHNEDLVKCISSNNEIHFKTKQYYQFRLDGNTFENEVLPFLKTL